MSSLRSNIWKLYVIRVAYDALFIAPVIMPFYGENGLSIAQLFYLQFVYTVANMVLEVPSGYLSDRWDRKKTILLGAFLGIAGMIIYATSTSFWGFFCAQILMAGLYSFHSGTMEAITYDTLLDSGTERDYRRIVGHQLFLSFGFQAFVSVAGGIIAIYSLRLNTYLTIIPFIFGLFFISLLREPKRHKSEEPNHLKLMWQISKNTLIHNVPLRSIIVLNAIIISLTFSLVWFTQPYQTMVNLPLILFGVTHALMTIGVACTSKLTHRAEKLIDDRVLLLLIALCVVGSYIGLGLITSLWGIAFLVIGRSSYGAISTLTGDIVNRMTTSDIRATVLSIQSFAYRVVFALISPLIGYATDVLTLNQTILYTGVIAGIALAIIFVLMKDVWKKLPS